MDPGDGNRIPVLVYHAIKSGAIPAYASELPNIPIERIAEERPILEEEESSTPKYFYHHLSVVSLLRGNV